ncbi:glycoside hydrolase family 13 protein [Nonomuraea cavernae]|uniref:Alpha-glucosidase n=1 Tax=Nonomuraea cavernae TaxID=2045107 RepID=A0A918DKU5_9ACTN|nr:glycoside hydrolase family 13 protein [Nonomuraea cavernae]MCA2186593.1 glycoside hydrolase family 13 protein [Nonomuraea cavernae]GGO71546.1 alpha-glucosidase [Nonomuraea cavernae]
MLADDDWWRDAVVYQVYPRSFADANGDGIGDLQGVRHRLGYLSELGVDAIWLSPFYTSPMADAGYDVADHRDVDPMFGTLDDFDELVRDAHARGIRVIVDLVPNHSSDRHPWFQAGLRDRYIFRDRPNDWESIFGGPAWTQVEDGQWYLHLFAPEQPDLNWEHPEVRAEFRDVLRFWLDRGVDGFRVDVAHGMVKAEGLPDVGPKEGPQAEMLGDERVPYFDQDGVHDIYREWRPILDSYPGGRMAVAEAWVSSPERLARYVGPDQLHQAFNFEFMLADYHAKAFRTVIEKALAEAELVGSPTTWVLSNHDKPRHVTRHGGLGRARAATLLMLALPGSAYVYNGEELGLPEVLDLPDELRQDPAFRRSGESRDGCRVPIPWTGEPGFGWRDPWLPIPASWGPLSAEAQHGDPGSTLSLYRAALRIRKEHPALGGGTLTWLDSPRDVLAFERDPGLAVVLNTGERPVELAALGLRSEVLLSSGPQAGDGTVAPDSTLWLRR